MRVLLSVLLAGVLAAAAGCGDGDGSRGDVAPEAWAGNVCEALGPWRTEIDALMVKAQQRMDAATSTEQARTGLVELLGGAEVASEQARARVAGAGAPDAENGRKVAVEFTGALGRLRDAYGKAKASIAALPATEPAAFYDAVAGAFARLREEYAAGGVNLDAVPSKELKKAFADVPACR
jgi:hypothetical protein